jgi:hypothetical protein
MRVVFGGFGDSFDDPEIRGPLVVNRLTATDGAFGEVAGTYTSERWKCSTIFRQWRVERRIKKTANG